MTSKQETVLNQIKNGLIVSCQAREGWAMRGSDIMAAFAKAAEEGGAVGIRANGEEDIRAISRKVKLPIIGIRKIWDQDKRVFITPDFESAKKVIEAGASIVALDGTKRERPNGETLTSIIQGIHKNYPDILVMADISTFEEGVYASDCGANIVSTTLCGYTPQTSHINGLSYELVEQLVRHLAKPIIAEGRIHTKEEALKILELGCHSIVVGTAITRPEIITSWYVEELKKRKASPTA
ncbi:N-acetylmannosamine-6-phosphate 2-epimerase [Caproiciproducens sp. CPB-2]|uniref:N-acetylmannosamine-6-phosphate 2-epimerase n=1 Tax=Caproiciproducens sp. CPB-2 TaxID=3030017 RepID=UPI0023DC9DCB|nr:N-acetylmannosamine-6-phosphate 2-epimerase [Caproiciproducens sp. CPB-2]MDF1493637.1 N-acetylmannosamine-6-phosphate 2-epimerase [Caproiciproducens sp. CPB-2]